jgi:RNA polymerase sigma-70 factor (ECF subfamily)
MSVHVPVRERFDDVLEECRRFLLAIANEELPEQLRAKGGASDLVQETLLAAHDARIQFRGTTLADLRAWLRTILLNELAMFRRRFQVNGCRDIAREVSGSVEMPDPRPVPSEVLARREGELRLAAAVERLPSPYRETVLLRIECELSFDEIGRRTNRTAEAARKNFTRALLMLRQIEPDLNEDET